MGILLDIETNGVSLTAPGRWRSRYPSTVDKKWARVQVLETFCEAIERAGQRGG